MSSFFTSSITIATIAAAATARFAAVAQRQHRAQQALAGALGPRALIGQQRREPLLLGPQAVDLAVEALLLCLLCGYVCVC